MPSPDPLGDLNAKINSVIARLEQPRISDIERQALGRVLDHYIAAREDLVIDDLDSAAAEVKAADGELAKVSAPSPGSGLIVGQSAGTSAGSSRTGGAKGEPSGSEGANGTGSPPDARGGQGNTPSSGAGSAAGASAPSGTASDGPTPLNEPSSADTANGAKRPLSQAGLLAACQQLGVGAAEIWAIVFTECDPPYSGYFRDGRPQILFERHIFHRLTDGRFDSSDPDISNVNPGGYGAGGSHQYDRLKQAMALDESAAIQSASWGMGQTLGNNFRALGYSSPQDLVRQMFASEDQQLDGMVREIRTAKIAGALAAHDWKNFAFVYNGPNYARNDYDGHLQSWFAKFTSGAIPDLRIRAAQMYLMFLGFEPADIDGMWGKRTCAAMNQFQAATDLPRTDALDDATFAALIAAGENVKPTS